MVRLGIVYEIHRNKAVVLTPDSEFLVIKRTKDMYLGQQVKFHIQDVKKSMKTMYRHISITSSVAAAFILAFLYFKVPFYGSVFGYINVDVNPSIELVVDKDFEVLQAKALNDDAKKISKEIKAKGKDAYSYINDFLDKCEEYGYINPEEENVVLVSASIDDSLESSLDDRELDKFLADINKMINSDDNDNITSKAIKVSPEYRKEAIKNKLSIGKYYLLERAKAIGIDLSVEGLDDEKVTEILAAIDKQLDSLRKEVSTDIKDEKTSETDNNLTEEPIDKEQVPAVQVTPAPTILPAVDPTTNTPPEQPLKTADNNDNKPQKDQIVATTEPKEQNKPKPTAKKTDNTAKNNDNKDAVKDGGLKIRLLSREKQKEHWFIDSDFHIINTSGKDIDLTKVKVRYYFTHEGRADMVGKVNNYSKLRTKDDSFVEQRSDTEVKISFHKVSGMDMYMEIEFNTGVLKKGEYLFIDTATNNTEWYQMDQTNDYSYIPNCERFEVTEKVTAYISDKLVWGKEPY